MASLRGNDGREGRDEDYDKLPRATDAKDGRNRQSRSVSRRSQSQERSRSRSRSRDRRESHRHLHEREPRRSRSRRSTSRQRSTSRSRSRSPSRSRSRSGSPLRRRGPRWNADSVRSEEPSPWVVLHPTPDDLSMRNLWEDLQQQECPLQLCEKGEDCVAVLLDSPESAAQLVRLHGPDGTLGPLPLPDLEWPVRVEFASAAEMQRIFPHLVGSWMERRPPGDWSCPQCGFHNFARRDTCRDCGTPATSALEPSGQAGDHIPGWDGAGVSAATATATTVATQQERWPRPFEVAGDEYVFDPETGFFYDHATHFYFDTAARMYLDAYYGIYLCYNADEKAFRVFEPSPPSSPPPPPIESSGTPSSAAATPAAAAGTGGDSDRTSNARSHGGPSAAETAGLSIKLRGPLKGGKRQRANLVSDGGFDSALLHPDCPLSIPLQGMHVCVVCERQFQSEEHLQRHHQESQKHKDAMQKLQNWRSSHKGIKGK